MKRNTDPQTVAVSAPDSLPGSAAGAPARRHRPGLAALFRKELADHLSSKRFVILFVLLLLVTTATLAGAVSSLSDGSTQST